MPQTYTPILNQSSSSNLNNYGTSTPPGKNAEKDADPEEKDFLHCIGDFGCWQYKISLLMALLKFPIAWIQLSVVFLAPPTDFWCAPPKIYKNLSQLEWMEMSVPKNASYLRHEGLNTGYCRMRNIFGHASSAQTEDTIPCLYGYSYNMSIFRSTIISEWNLVCGYQRLIDLSQMVLMMGVLLGNVLFGLMADKKGRKFTLITCIVFQALLGITCAWMPYFWTFLLARFLLAFFNGGTMIVSFVMCMEIVGGKWRTRVPILYQIPFGFGNAIMAGIAYELRNWRHFQTAVGLLCFGYVAYFWCLPESPRWLLVMNRKEEAELILRQAAKENGKDPEKVAQVLKQIDISVKDGKNPGFLTLFREESLRKRSIFLCLNWMIVGITFYAFSQYLGHVSHANLFFTVAMGGLIALPGTFACVFIIGRCGRRHTIAAAHLLTAICFLLILLFPRGAYKNDWPRIVFAGLGVVGMSISMPALYLFTGELYPTVLRNLGVGVTVMFARIGSMLAPFIIALEDMTELLPLFILGLAAILEALLVLPLPETTGQPLSETVQDLEMQESPRLVKNNYKIVNQSDQAVDDGEEFS